MAAHRRWPRTPILLLVVASIFPDVVDLVKALLNVHVEHGLYSHTLPAVALQALGLGVVTGLWRRSAASGLVVALVVALHLPADYVTGTKLLWAGGPVIGLNLYDYPLVDCAIEAVLACVCWNLLRHSTAGPRWVRSPAVLAVLLLTQVTANLISLAHQSQVPLPWSGMI